MTEPRAMAEHGSRIITALERAWAAIQDQHPDVRGVVGFAGKDFEAFLTGHLKINTTQSSSRACGPRQGRVRS